MKNSRLLFALILVSAAACSAVEPTSPLPEAPRNSVYAGGGNGGTPPDSTAKPDSTKVGG
jgi:hypothetical protein